MHLSWVYKGRFHWELRKKREGRGKPQHFQIKHTSGRILKNPEEPRLEHSIDMFTSHDEVGKENEIEWSENK